jgi:peptidoglycan/xylan/chitin deacetylase (PgdA/CDA1 family)
MRAGGAYALETLLTISGIASTFALDQSEIALHLHYGSDGSEADVVIPADHTAPWQHVKPQLSWAMDEKLPILHCDSLPRPAPAEDGDQIRLQFDLVAPTLWLLSRQEEVEASSMGCGGGFPARKNWLVRNGLIQRPVVNLYATLLGQALHEAARSRGWPWITTAPWPHGCGYAVCLAHDVDEVLHYDPQCGWRTLVHSLKRQEPRGIIRGLAFLIRGLWRQLVDGRDDPSWNFDDIMALEQTLGFRSTFYFVPLTTSGSRDPGYDVTQRRLSKVIADLNGGGWEVAVHGSFHSYLSGAQLRRERAQLEKVTGAQAQGIRQHYLRLSIPHTFRAQRQAGFVYDSSLGHSEMAGFRAGVAAPFSLFDAERDETLSLLELPLTVMDGTLFWELGCDQSSAVRRTLEMVSIVRQLRGMVTLLWHQRVVDQRRYPGWWAAYAAVLEHLQRDEAAWVTTASQVAQWWQRRRALTLRATLVEAGAQRLRLSYRTPCQIDGLCLKLWVPPDTQFSLLGARGRIVQRETGQALVHLDSLPEDTAFHLDICHQ